MPCRVGALQRAAGQCLAPASLREDSCPVAAGVFRVAAALLAPLLFPPMILLVASRPKPWALARLPPLLPHPPP